jgi:predicted 3-demethylubiquinone-9 3-methyltransferase (glyoxalase superfamily)
MPVVTPFLWFVHDAEEAANFYVSVFKNSRILAVTHYPEAGPEPAGSVMIVDFELDGSRIRAINASLATAPQTAFAQGKVSLYASCENQAEVDRLWEALSLGGEELPCGWVRDRYGFTWNIVPVEFEEMMRSDNEAAVNSAMRAMLQMKKLDLDELRRAFTG